MHQCRYVVVQCSQWILCSQFIMTLCGIKIIPLQAYGAHHVFIKTTAFFTEPFGSSYLPQQFFGFLEILLMKKPGSQNQRALLKVFYDDHDDHQCTKSSKLV